MKRRTDPDGDHPIPYGPIRLFDIREDDQTSVADHSIEPTKSGYGEVNDPATRRRVLEIFREGSGISAGCGDLIGNCFGDRWIETAAVLRDTRIMDNDRTTTGRDQPRIGGAETTPGAGHDDRLTVKTDGGRWIGLLRHRDFLYVGISINADATTTGCVNIE
jgi:hypothetical protein